MPIQLLVESAAPVPVADQVAVSWQGSGQEVDLEPLTLGTPKLLIELLRYSLSGAWAAAGGEEGEPRATFLNTMVGAAGVNWRDNIIIDLSP